MRGPELDHGSGLTTSDRFLRALARPAHKVPRLSLTAVGLANRGREVVRPSPRRRVLAKRYADLSGVRPGRIARDAAANDARTALFEAVVRRYGIGRVSRIIEWHPLSPLESLRQEGGVVATWHAGATLTAVGAGFEAAGLPAVFFVHGGTPEPVSGIQFAAAWEDPRGAMRRARAELASGGIVIIAIDGSRGSDTPPVTTFGAPTRFRRGAFALAREAAGAMYPLAAGWRRFRPVLTIQLGDAYRPGTGGADAIDARLAAQLGRWLELFLVATTEQLRPGLSFT